MSFRRKIFYGVTVATIVLLLFLPATGWLARLQLLPFRSGLNDIRETYSDHATTNATYYHAASREPDNFLLQFALALRAATNGEKIALLESLRKRFPQEGALSAALLKVMWSDTPSFQRAEEDSLLPPRPPLYSSGPPGFVGAPPGFGGLGGSAPISQVRYVPQPEKRVTPENLAKFDAIAADGERLEPDNAFFPALRAACYFEAHRDADALAAWKRAARKTNWEDHAMEEYIAQAKLLRAVNGNNEVGFLNRFVLRMGINYPHYARIRFASRVVIAKAVASELTGDRENGIVLRRLTRQLGQTIQSHSKNCAGNLLGSSIIRISLQRSGGTPAIAYQEFDDNNELKILERNRNATVRYLTRTGHVEEVASVNSAVDASIKTRRFFREEMGKSYIYYGDKISQLRFSWLFCALCITGAVFSLFFAGGFGLIFRFSPRLQKGEPLQSSARWGVSIGVLLPILAYLCLCVYEAQHLFKRDWMKLEIGLGIIGVAMLIVPPIWCRLSWRQVGHGILVLLTMFAIMGGIGSIFYWVVPPFYRTASMLQPQELSAPNEYVPTLAESIAAFLLPFVYIGLQVIVPLLMLSVFALFSRILRIPVAAGVTRGMRAMAVPLACLFIFSYVACFFATLRHENAAIAEMERMSVMGERKVYEEIAQKP